MSVDGASIPIPREMLESLWFVRFVYSANAIIPLYEFVITFEQERRLIWPCELSIAKMAFFLNRYFPIVTTVFILAAYTIFDPSASEFCERAMVASCFMCGSQITLAQAILFLRAYVVWERNPIIGIFILVIMTGSLSVGYYYAAAFSGTFTAGDLGLLSPGCQVGTEGRLVENLVIAFITETLSIILLVSKSLWHYHRSGRLLQKYSKCSAPSLLKTMLQDGIAYFACIFALLVTNMLVNLLVKAPMRNVFVAMQATLQNVLCSRLVLHVRSVHASPSVSTFHLTPIQFTSSPAPPGEEWRQSVLVGGQTQLAAGELLPRERARRSDAALATAASVREGIYNI